MDKKAKQLIKEFKLTKKMLATTSKSQVMSAKEIAEQTGFKIKVIEAILGSSDLGTTNINTVAKWLKINPSIVEKVYALAFK